MSAIGLGVFADPDAGVANLVRALRAGGRLAVAGRDDPDRVRRLLERAGLVEPGVTPIDIDDARVRIVTAQAPR